MSSSTESMSKGEEKKGNSENNPKDEMPKETSTVESNSKGARPKTSSTLQKSKKQTEEEKQSLKVLIMNTGTSGTNKGEGKSATTGTNEGEGKSATNEDKGEGKSVTNQDEGNAERRKQSIQNVINKHDPDLDLFQEFTWKKIRGGTWKKYPMQEHYEITTGDDARIMYNKYKLTVEEMPSNELQKIIEELQRPKSKNSPRISLDFTPIPRMSLRLVETKSVPIMKFICISWHGEYKTNTKSKLDKFQDLMTFLNQIYVMKKLPLLIAGDFNVKMELIEEKVKDPFKLYKYTASDRQKTKDMIDYFIASRELQLSDITPVDLKKDSQAKDPEEVLDHDPIIAILKRAPTPETDLPLDEVTDTNGQIDELPAIGGLNISDVTPEDQ